MPFVRHYHILANRHMLALPGVREDCLIGKRIETLQRKNLYFKQVA